MFLLWWVVRAARWLKLLTPAWLRLLGTRFWGWYPHEAVRADTDSTNMLCCDVMQLSSKKR